MLTEHALPYFADHGTLLGLIRENGLIAHDTDMDFSLPPDVSLPKVYAALSAVGFRVERGYSLNGELEEMTFFYRGALIDFFKCHRIGDRLGHYVFVPTYDAVTGDLVRVMAHERVRPPLQGLVTRRFGPNRNVEISIPVNAVEYLTASYGNWKVPDSTTDFNTDKIPTQYRDIFEGCRFVCGRDVVTMLKSQS